MDIDSSYFEEVVSNINKEDIAIMALLHSNGAVDPIYAIKTLNIREQTQMSKSSLNLILNRLKFASLINSINSTSKYSIYLTEFGKAALHIKTNGGMTL
ncbi:hypothetical protein [Priestia megaterium]|uniref:hypothetical protein n=1 Tax=Priestia megaterium TaxID=1404 RepID=UPI00112DD1F3|nr:hypothetical protein [Priestia megaterium]TPF17955.1 hypothetical protein CBE78_01655 [Priestia megaterium]TPF22063.1 hypothetical protein CBE79_04160 [Priestia megaterium]